MTISRVSSVVATVALSFSLIGCSTQQDSNDSFADLAIVGGRVWTGSAAQPWAEAVAVKGSRLLQVGSSKSVQAAIGPSTQVHDVSGGLVVPGFIDTHVHFLDGGFGLASVQLRDAATPEMFAERVAQFVETIPEGTWILNGDWDHEQWAKHSNDLPHRDWIDQATPNHPVFVFRLDGHMALANSAALRAAGLLDAEGNETATSTEVAGGEAVRDADGRLTGVLKDNALGLVAPYVPKPSLESEDRALEAASRYVLKQGVTTVHHMGTWADLAVFERAEEKGTLALSIHSCVPLSTWEKLQARIADQPSPADSLLQLGCLKGMVDGSLGSHTAVFFDPYTDLPESGTGLYVTAIEEIDRDAAAADRAGLRVNVHAIGDRAIRETLDTFARIAATNGERDRRFRIEHAQHIHPDDIQRFAAEGVIASMQPYHAIDDGRWATRVIGVERSQTTYAFRSLIDSGAEVAFGSDWAVAPATPLEGIYAAATRQTLDGNNPGGWVPEQRISVEQALRAYTVAGARAGFEEAEKGTLEVGKRADIAVIDRDILALAKEDWPTIKDAQIALTIVAGKVVERR